MRYAFFFWGGVCVKKIIKNYIDEQKKARGERPKIRR